MTTKDNKSSSSFTKCVCPKCGEEHKVYMFWTGTLPPKKYCKSCLNIVSHCSSIELDMCSQSKKVRSGRPDQDSGC